MSGIEGKNQHYSDQLGHRLRSEYHRLSRMFGTPPNCLPGFNGIEDARRRRTMRRITDAGRGQRGR
jgi:hypothetical protein